MRARIARSGMDFWAVLAAAAIATLLLVVATQMQAQTYTVLHSFTGSDGSSPEAGLSMDRSGNLYGTTYLGGYTGGHCYNGCGTVFKLARKNGNWVMNSLYTFTGADGALPSARVIVGPDGSLYGTTTYGGAAGYGVVFRLRPPATLCRTVSCPWNETVLHSFTGGSDGGNPLYGDLTLDANGNVYGTTLGGGSSGNGVVYELTPSNGSWVETVLYSFQGGNDGSSPSAGVTFDSAGNLYGTTVGGGTQGEGIVYELTHSASGWTESIIHDFSFLGSDGSQPYGGLITDEAGNLFGISSVGGDNGGGVVYELAPSNGSWIFSSLYQLAAYEGTLASLTMSNTGALYGTLLSGDVEVFKLTNSGGSWTQIGISGSAGEFPFGNVILDASGNLYTTASSGGTTGDGIVFQITPN